MLLLTIDGVPPDGIADKWSVTVAPQFRGKGVSLRASGRYRTRPRSMTNLACSIGTGNLTQFAPFLLGRGSL